MKQSENDDKIRQLLKQSAPEPNENKWFTINVLHRLPSKRNKWGWLVNLVYIVATIICIAFWIKYAKEFDSSVITYRMIAEYITLSTVSLGICMRLVLKTLNS